jgi:hypothetical protein
VVRRFSEDLSDKKAPLDEDAKKTKRQGVRPCLF